MPNRPTAKDARRDAAREKARQMREAEARKKRRNRVLAISAAAVALVLVIGVAAIAITRASAGGAVVQPPGVTADGGIVLGKSDAPHTVTLFEDYQCPVCKAYEPTVVPWLDQQVQAGTIKLELRPLVFLDDRFRGDYSTRAANAAFCLAGQQGVDFLAFNEGMYAAQPAEGTGGLTDSKIIGIAEQAGGNIGTCVAAGTYEGFARKVNDAAFDLTDAQGAKVVGGTPTVLVDGELVTGAGGQGAPSQQQIAAALGIAGS